MIRVSYEVLSIKGSIYSLDNSSTTSSYGCWYLQLTSGQFLCLSSFVSMAVSRVSPGYSRWKQWWRRSPNTCCSKRILLLLVWLVLFTFSYGVLVYSVPAYMYNIIVSQTTIFLSYSFAPLIGWLLMLDLEDMKLLNLVQLFLFWPAYCSILQCSLEKVFLH